MSKSDHGFCSNLNRQPPQRKARRQSTKPPHSNVARSFSVPATNVPMNGVGLEIARTPRPLNCKGLVCVYRLNRRKTSSLYSIILYYIWQGDGVCFRCLHPTKTHLLHSDMDWGRSIHVPAQSFTGIWTWKPFRRTSIIRRMLR